MEDFDKICRTCLTESTDFKSLFMVQYVNEEQLRLSEILRACTSIQILEDDVLPKQVCAQCEHHILNAFNFKQQCHKSEAVLRVVAAESVKFELKSLRTNEASSPQSTEILLNDVLEENYQLATDLIKEESSKIVESFDVKEEGSSEKAKQDGQLTSYYSIDQQDINLTSELIKTDEEDETLQPTFPCESLKLKGLKRIHRFAAKPLASTDGGRSYMAISHLKRHMRAHTKEKPYQCTICLKHYMQNEDLENHFKIHKDVICSDESNIVSEGSEYTPDNGNKPNGRLSTPILCVTDPFDKDSHSSSIPGKTCNDVTGKAFDDVSRNKLKSNRSRRKHQCMFCDIPIANNFSRHMIRNHRDELEVKKILSLSKNSPERKHLFEKLRKEGDFRTGNRVPVVHRGKQTQSKENLLPCIFCKGYYAKTTLRYHIKKCVFNNRIGSPQPGRKSYQSQGQTLMVSNVGPNDPLRVSGIFDSLVADEVSLVAKQDKIICEVARQYIISHSDQQLIARRNMRRLARVLIEARKIENNSKISLLSLLNPSKFKIIVDAVRKITQYNAEAKSSPNSPVALQIGTLLKKAISTAYSMEIQRDVNSSKLNLLIALRTLINHQWASKVSIKAGQNLQSNKFNKPMLIPMAEDIAKMKRYLDNLIEQSMAQVKQEENRVAYRSLTEAIYCSLLLFNRRRVGELQRIPLDVYLKYHDTKSSKEFGKLLTPSEQIFLKSLKRVVIKTHRGKEVFVLFDKFTVAGIDLLIEKRNQYFAQSNQYLFGFPGTITCINGNQVLRKYASRALGDVTKATCLTSTRLRKHLATMYQIFKMGTDELEQLAKFMGHTPETHDEWYKLPSDVYQTAKVSKMLLLPQNNWIEHFKGRSVNDIQVDNEIVENEKSDSEESEPEKNYEINDNFTVSASSICIPNKANRRRLIPWSQDEKKATEQFFKIQIEKKIAAKKNEVIDLMDKYPHLFKNRTWASIKVYVQNKYTKR